MRGLLILLKDKPYRVYKKRIIVGIRKNKIKLVSKLFSVIKLPFKLKRPSRNYL